MRERSGANADRRSGSAWYPRSEEDLAAGRDDIRALYNDPLFVTTFTNGIVIDGTYIPSIDTPIVDDTTPPAIPSGVTITTGLRTIFVSWDDVADLDTVNGQGTYEVQIATDAAFTTDLRTLRKSGTFTQFSDLQPNTLYYARVRAIDRFGNAGSFSPSTNATTTQAGTSDITTGSITTGLLDADAVTAEKLATIELEVGKYIQSTSYTAGASGWRINADGTAEFQDVTVRGVYKTANSGARLEMLHSGGAGVLNVYTGDAGELTPGNLTMEVIGSGGAATGHVHLDAPAFASGAGAGIDLYTAAAGGGSIDLAAGNSGSSSACIITLIASNSVGNAGLRVEAGASAPKVQAQIGGSDRLLVQNASTVLSDNTRTRISLDGTDSRIVSPNGSYRVSTANSLAGIHDGTRDRVYVNGTESVDMSPNGSWYWRATNNGIDGYNSAQVRFLADATRAALWSPDGNSTIEIHNGILRSFIGGSVGFEINGTTVTFPAGISSSAVATSAAHINSGASNHLYRFTSREAYKRDIASWTSEMLIRRVRPVTFLPLEGDPVWKELPEAARVRQLGFIVEELAAVSPMLATWDLDGEPTAPNVTALLALLVSEVQRLDRRLDILEATARTTTPTGGRP